MNEILELLPIPAERDLPPGQLELRRDALVAASHERSPEPLARRALRAARGHIAGAWLSLLAMLALGLPSCAAECPDNTAQHGVTQWRCWP